MITETTCCTTVRSSKRMKEYELCCKVQECLEKGGKVLVPLLMMGRSQEICMIFEEHWARAQLAYPIIDLRQQSEVIRGYSEQVRASKHFAYGLRPTPAVVLAGPAMLDAGSSLQIFKSLAPDSKNLVVIPGYCLPGTVGNLVQAKSKQIELDEEIIRVKCEVETVSHSDHTDSRGILELIAQTSPQQVVLVHGAEPLMKSFQPIVTRRLKLPCYSPGVGETVELVAADSLQVLASPALLLEAQVVEAPPVLSSLPVMHGSAPPAATFSALARKRGRDLYELHPRSEEGLAQCGLKAHRVRFSHRCTLSANDLQEALSIVGHENPLEGEGPWDLNIGGLSCKVGKEAAAFVVTVLWDRKAEAEVPKLSTFLEALGAGGLGARG
ncbi:Integrator complex subunit 11 (Int11) (Cleavage and polyadenylation-specific factor 3-like protein) (CPSF3-like protein) (Protein related to CPSF subunits of 68 kDa) (RC-68) [Durusdinium trenchii]|uniref:Integrator complex subunit 11 (Int11) (Cleavage and polyadenylation-specific factor 3-like protein) (CPSF3-like protein) (Protein related to CPSF subunits of 68 kDa) (RC-68) n=1 Tax=Durusdinium trenchii TaxID=1381693 RepID=A0ABP0RVT8_9DINO